jgi:drug/metabolite transporter (DMT)-like permease
MRFHHHLRVKTFVLLVLMVLSVSFGNVILSRGMKQIGRVALDSPAATAITFARTFTSGTIWLGIACLLLFFVCYLVVLSWADYSFVSPATATSYAVVALLGTLLLGEVVTSVRWAGVAVICLGVLLVSHTPPRTTERSGAD